MALPGVLSPYRHPAQGGQPSPAGGLSHGIGSVLA